MSASFLACIFLLLSYFDSCQCQNWTKGDADERGLKCWECIDTEETGGFCTEHHDGDSVDCPPTDYPRDMDVDTLADYKCWIMKVVSTKSGHIDITKGCSNRAYEFFMDDEAGKSVPIHPGNGCVSTVGNFVIGKAESSYNITMCFCDTTDCNKEKIDGMGWRTYCKKRIRRNPSAPAFPPSYGYGYAVLLWLDLG